MYEFDLISDHQIDPAESTTTSTSSSSLSGTTSTTLPTPILVTTVAPLSPADAGVLALGEQINAQSDDLVATLIAGDDGVIDRADYSWDAPSASVVVSAALSPTYTDSPDTAAWIIARDRNGSVGPPEPVPRRGHHDPPPLGHHR